MILRHKAITSLVRFPTKPKPSKITQRPAPAHETDSPEPCVTISDIIRDACQNPHSRYAVLTATSQITASQQLAANRSIETPRTVHFTSKPMLRAHMSFSYHSRVFESILLKKPFRPCLQTAALLLHRPSFENLGLHPERVVFRLQIPSCWSTWTNLLSGTAINPQRDLTLNEHPRSIFDKHGWIFSGVCRKKLPNKCRCGSMA